MGPPQRVPPHIIYYLYNFLFRRKEINKRNTVY
ncbi:hypothetical protein [Pseudomonas phage PhiPizzaParty]|nr:hypothetical protein [Pseudomonas phage PhiPizzaParty]